MCGARSSEPEGELTREVGAVMDAAGVAIVVLDADAADEVALQVVTERDFDAVDRRVPVEPGGIAGSAVEAEMIEARGSEEPRRPAVTSLDPAGEGVEIHTFGRGGRERHAPAAPHDLA